MLKSYFVPACRDTTDTVASGGVQQKVPDSAWPGRPRLHEIAVQNVEAVAQPAPTEPRRLSLKEKRQIKRASRMAATRAAEQKSVCQAAGMALPTSPARRQRVLSRKAVNRTPTASTDAAAWPAGAGAAGSATHPVHGVAAAGIAAGRPSQAAGTSDHPSKEGGQVSDGPPVDAAQPAAPADADHPGSDSGRPPKRPRATLAPALVAANLAAQKQHRERWVAQGLATGMVPTDKPPETSVLRGLPPLGTELLFHVELHHALLTAAVRGWARGASAASAASQGGPSHLHECACSFCQGLGPGHGCSLSRWPRCTDIPYLCAMQASAKEKASCMEAAQPATGRWVAACLACGGAQLCMESCTPSLPGGAHVCSACSSARCTSTNTRRS